jgi:hypothetical protein
LFRVGSIADDADICLVRMHPAIALTERENGVPDVHLRFSD